MFVFEDARRDSQVALVDKVPKLGAVAQGKQRIERLINLLRLRAMYFRIRLDRAFITAKLSTSSARDQ